MPIFFFTNTVNGNRISNFFVAHGERPRTPLKKITKTQFCKLLSSEELRQLWQTLSKQQIPDYLGLLVNWVNVIYENVVSICPSKEH